MTPSTSELTETVAQLAQRVRRLEDELEITKVLTRYGFAVDAVDAGDADATARLYTENTEIDLGPSSRFVGTEGARQLVLDERHQAIVGRCAHTIGPLVVEVDVEGDRASAVGYARVYVHDPETEESQLWRISCTAFELVRCDGSWCISKRTSRALGTDRPAELFRSHL